MEKQFEKLMNNIANVKSSLGMAETKANEVEHTTNTGFGEELVAVNVLQSDFLDLIPNYSTFLTAFPGNWGRTLPSSIDVPVIGETGLYSGSSEWTTGALYDQVAQGTNKLPTAKVTIKQNKYKMTVDISDELLRFSITDIERIVKERLARSAARTIEAAIINGDTETGATGNVNSDDAAPAAGSYYLFADGLRKDSIVNKGVAGKDTLDMGTITWDDYVDMQTQMGDLGANAEDVVYLFNRNTFNASMKLTEFKDASQNGKGSTINSLAVTNILGADVFINRDINKTEADGKISAATPANNTKGQVILAHRQAVQYGYNGDFNMEVVRVPGEGIQVIGYFYFGYAIANQLAGQTDPTVVTGINATVA